MVRPALSQADVEARLWLMNRAAEAGLDPTIDAIGTTLARASAAAGTPRLLLGSHSDTQATGGWLDGALGMVFGLEACRAVAEAGGPAVLDLINFQDEEGRFGSLVGSSVFTGAEPPWAAVSAVPESAAPAVTLAEAAAEHPELTSAGGFLHRLDPQEYVGFFEAHIEQGRRLERAGHGGVGVVTAIVGLRQFSVVFQGEQNHAGTTTMADRADAATTAFEFAVECATRFRAAVGPDADSVWTFGQCEIEPGAASIVPGAARLTVQFRDPDSARLDALEDTLALTVAEINDAGPVRVKVDQSSVRPVPPVKMDPKIREVVEAAADDRLGPGR